MANPKRTKTSVSKSLDALMSRYIRLSKQECEHCGDKPHDPLDLQWCHIKSRRYKSIRWDFDNCFCLCARCHRNFTDHPDEYIEWIKEYAPKKLERLQEKYIEKTGFKWDLEGMIKFESELKEKLENLKY